MECLKQRYGGKKVCVYGLGRAGLSAVELLLSCGAILYAYDDNVEAEKTVPDGVTWHCPSGDEWNEIEALVFSPGIPLTHPTPHKVAMEAKAHHVPVICDIELLYHRYPEAKFIAVTGTNGKSTVTNLIYHLLESLGKNVAMGGNIGVPASQLTLEGEDKIFVIEVSSYQCDLLEETRFDISVLLNITPDHIDRHGDMAGYVKAKERIFRSGRALQAIIAVDDDYTRAVASEMLIKEGVKLITASCYENDADFHYEGEELPQLPGEHNKQNIACSLAVLHALQVEHGADVREALRSYVALKHRMQYVGVWQNLTFVNDSKATNAVATKQALQSYDNILWIVGGVAKQGGISELLPYMEAVKYVCLIGKSSKEFVDIFQGNIEYSESNAITQAVQDAVAYGKASPDVDYTVLLSPACASFDQYPNFEARGDDFIRNVEEL